jgi:hypothetical protein
MQHSHLFVAQGIPELVVSTTYSITYIWLLSRYCWFFIGMLKVWVRERNRRGAGGKGFKEAIWSPASSSVSFHQ